MDSFGFLKKVFIAVIDKECLKVVSLRHYYISYILHQKDDICRRHRYLQQHMQTTQVFWDEDPRIPSNILQNYFEVMQKWSVLWGREIGKSLLRNRGCSLKRQEGNILTYQHFRQKSRLDTRYKLYLYKIIIKSIWTYGIHLWRSTSKSKILKQYIKRNFGSTKVCSKFVNTQRHKHQHSQVLKKWRQSSNKVATGLTLVLDSLMLSSSDISIYLKI